MKALLVVKLGMVLVGGYAYGRLVGRVLFQPMTVQERQAAREFPPMSAPNDFPSLVHYVCPHCYPADQPFPDDSRALRLCGVIEPIKPECSPETPLCPVCSAEGTRCIVCGGVMAHVVTKVHDSANRVRK